MATRTLEAIDADIAKVRASITKLLTVGEEYRANTGGTAVRSRAATLTDQRRYLHELQIEREHAADPIGAGTHALGDF